MNSDIRLSIGFWKHPKTIKLSKKIGLEGVRSLIVLWGFTAQSRPKGTLEHMDVDDIEIAADWQGEEGLFVSTLLALNWLERNDSGDYVIHGWEEHQRFACYAPERSEQAQRAIAARWAKEREKSSCAKTGTGNTAGSGDKNVVNTVSNTDSYGEHTVSNTDGNTVSNTDSYGEKYPSSSSSSSSSSRPKGKKTKHTSYSSNTPYASPELSAKASGPPPPSSGSVPDAVITLPLNTGEEHPVTRGDVDQWQDLYPAVNVLQELRNMKGWLSANKTRRKTKTGIMRFIQSWLAREQNKGNARASPQRRVGMDDFVGKGEDYHGESIIPDWAKTGVNNA